MLTVFNSVNAVNINSATITSKGECGSLLIYKGIVVKTNYAHYIPVLIKTQKPQYSLTRCHILKKKQLIVLISKHAFQNVVIVIQYLISKQPFVVL